PRVEGDGRGKHRVAIVQRNALVGGNSCRTGGIVGPDRVKTGLPDAEIGEEVASRGERLTEAHDAIVSGVGNVKITLKDGQPQRQGETWREGTIRVAPRPVGQSGEKIALTDDQIGRLAVGTADCVLPG